MDIKWIFLLIRISQNCFASHRITKPGSLFASDRSMKPASLFASERVSKSVVLLEKFLQDFMEAKYLRGIVFIKGEVYYGERQNGWENFQKIIIRNFATKSLFYLRCHRLFNETKKGSMNSYSQIINSVDIKNRNRLLFIAPLFSKSQLVDLTMIFTNSENQRMNWLILCDEISDFLIEKLPLRADNLANFVKINSENKSLLIYDCYKSVPNGDVHEILIGIWNFDFGEMKKKIYFEEFSSVVRNFNPSRERKNLSEVLIRCISSEHKIYVSNPNVSNKSVNLEGTFINIWNFLEQVLKFKTEFLKVESHVYGSYDAETDSWNGYVNELIQKRVDVVLGDMDIILSRSKVIDYLTPIDDDRRVLIYKVKGDSDMSWSQYLKEFSSSAWIMIMITYLSCIFILKFISCVSPKEKRISLTDAFLIITSMFCNKGSDFSFKSHSVRIFMKTALFSSFILISFYTSLLFMFLTTDPRPPFTDFEGLYANRDKFKVIFTKDTSTASYFQYSNRKVMQNIWKEMLFTDKANLPTTFKETLEIVLQGNVAAFTSKHLAELQSFYGFFMFNQPMVSIISLAVPKEYPYKHILNYYIQIFMESGSYSRCKTRRVEFLKKNNTSIASESSWFPFGMKNIYFVFLLLGVCVLVSILILAIELFIEKNK